MPASSGWGPTYSAGVLCLLILCRGSLNVLDFDSVVRTDSVRWLRCPSGDVRTVSVFSVEDFLGIDLSSGLPAFDPFVHHRHRLVSCSPVLTVDKFALNRGPERLRKGVVEATSDAAHGAAQHSGAKAVTNGLAPVSHSFIRIHNCAVGEHCQRVKDGFAAP